MQDSGGQARIPLAHRVWLYMPFMHSEDISDQEVRFGHVLAGAQHAPSLTAPAPLMTCNIQRKCTQAPSICPWLLPGM